MSNDNYQSGFYVRIRGRVSGPHPLADLLRMVRRGTLGRAQEVSRDRVSWDSAQDITELFGGPFSLTSMKAASSAPRAVEAAGEPSLADAGIYYRQGDETFGPMAVPLLESLAVSGRLSPDAIVWEDGAAMSRPARSHPLLENAIWPDLGEDDQSNRGLFKTSNLIAALAILSLVGLGVGLWWAHTPAASKDASQAKVENATAEKPTVSSAAPISFRSPAASAMAPKARTANPNLTSVGTVAAAMSTPPRAYENSTPPTLPPSSASATGGSPVATMAAPLQPHGVDKLRMVTGVNDEAILAETVGLVVNGATIIPPAGQPYERPHSSGTCFAVSPDGFLVTNNHVIEQDTDFRDAVRKTGSQFMPQIWVFFGKTKFQAKVISASAKNDLAVLRIARQQPFFRLSSTDKATPRNTDVFALGFPGIGREPLSVGEIRRRHAEEGEQHQNVEDYFNKDRDFDFMLTRGPVSRISKDSDDVSWITHEALIRHGNSGGPLVTSAGIVVGVNTQAQLSERDIQTNNSFEISQYRRSLDKEIPTVSWVDPRELRQ